MLSPPPQTLQSLATKLRALRDQMVAAGVMGYLVPRSDEFLGEYVPNSAARLAWLTGFDGSAGFALILMERGVVCSDSRYTIQLKQQVDAAFLDVANSRAGGLSDWLRAQGVIGITIGFDPALLSVAEVKAFEKEFSGFDCLFKPLGQNLVDAIWADRPRAPCSRVEPFLETIAGRSAAQKRALIADQLSADGMAAAILPDPADMAWLLNIRGRDVPHTPYALSYGVIYADGAVDWVIDPQRIDPDLTRALGNSVRIIPPDQAEQMVMHLKAKVARAPVLMDPHHTPYRLAQMMEDRNIKIDLGKNPVILPRACKTLAEQESMRDAHRRDAVAVIKFLYWLDQNWETGKIDELAVADKLYALRSEDAAWRDTSFDTIAGMGPHGAIVHYRANERSNAKIEPDGLLLVDSGAQYIGGTTDITRTILIGAASEAMRTHYTAVLKAHIAMAAAVFPRGTNGAQIDALARAELWAEKIDFAHRIGHGVGCYLSVHEPALDISARGLDPFLPGMTVSNEPGYYREGQYGIRLENVVLVRDTGAVGGADGTMPFYDFETLTLVPFDPHLTKLSVLNAREKEWLAAYHTRILDVVGPSLPGPERNWLAAVTKYFC